MKLVALIISILFHPLLMATYCSALLFYVIPDTIYFYLTSSPVKWRLTVVVFLFTFLFPVINIFLLYRLKRIPSPFLSGQRERTFPYLLTSLFYFGLTYLLWDLNIWSSFKVFIAGGGLCILLVALINMKYKISAHMAGLGGVLGVLIALSSLIRHDFTMLYILVVIIAGITGYARVRLSEHRPSQVYTGFLLGVIVQASLFFSAQKLILA